MDYRRFLGRSAEQVLAYTGGASVSAEDRRLRVSGELRPGWWRFRISGRSAAAVAEAEPPSLDALPRVAGHLVGEWLFLPGGAAEEVLLRPEEEPPRFAVVSARRWHSGELLFDQVAFETEAEESARRRLEEGGTLSELAGVPATLRAAFAFSVAAVVGARVGIPARPQELRAAWREIAEEGAMRAERTLRELALRREQQRVRAEEARQAANAPPAVVITDRRRPPSRLEPVARAIAALEAAGATVGEIRRLGGGQLEVSYRFLGGRYLSVVDAQSLQVIDAGICLAGADRMVTLESLPSVIREALEEDALVVTRHG